MTVPDPPATNVRRAAAFMLLSALAFALMGASVKLATSEVTSTMVVFFRNAVALVLLLPWLLGQGSRGLATRHLPGHLVRGLAGLAAMVCFFFAIAHMRLGDAVLLNNCFPLFLPMAEWAWMREPVSRTVWKSLALGFVGVVFILKPGTGVFSAVAMAGLASAVLAAIAQVGVRHLTRTEPITRIVFYFGLIALCGSALMLPFAWRTPGAAVWWPLVATGVFATAGQFALTRAYSYAAASVVGPFIYAGVVFAALLDWLVWRTLPDRWFIPGAILVAAAGAWMLRHDADLPGPAPEAGSTLG